jgi:hypothetical protein
VNCYFLLVYLGCNKYEQFSFILSGIGGCAGLIRRVLDWMIRFVDNLYTQVVITGSTALLLIYTIYSSP